MQYCTSCGKSIEEGSKFCQSCGAEIETQVTDAKDENPSQERLESGDICQVCYGPGPTKYVEFYQNIGMLVMRSHKSIRGELCKTCITYAFWRFTLIDLFLGWWGVISFIVTPFYILNNIGRYLMCLRLPKPSGTK